MKLPWMGIGRVALVGALGAGLVAAAQADPRTVQVRAGAQGAQAAPAGATTVPLSSRLVTCAGQELTGTEGVPDVELTGTVNAVSLPAELRPADVVGDGAMAIANGPVDASASATQAGACAAWPGPPAPRRPRTSGSSLVVAPQGVRSASC